MTDFKGGTITKQVFIVVVKCYSCDSIKRIDSVWLADQDAVDRIEFLDKLLQQATEYADKLEKFAA